jgi:hypothetical protein
MACPDYAGKHPFHDRRWIVTEGTEIERGYDPRPGEWHTRNGSLVAKMLDSHTDYASAIVRACNSHAALVEVLGSIIANEAYGNGARLTDELRDEARAALQLAKEGQQ